MTKEQKSYILNALVSEAKTLVAECGGDTHDTASLLVGAALMHVAVEHDGDVPRAARALIYGLRDTAEKQT